MDSFMKQTGIRLISNFHNITEDEAAKYLEGLITEKGEDNAKSYIISLSNQVQRTHIRPYSNS